MFKPIICKIFPFVTHVFKRNCCVFGCPGSISVPACYWSVLPNGIRVISEQTCAPVANISLFIEAGPRFETVRNNGITHFIEHMAYKGFCSKARIPFEEDLLKIGAKMTANTSREVQIFSGTCLSAQASTIIQYLWGIMNELEISHNEIQTEMSVIAQELNETDKNNTAVMFDYLHQTAFQGTPLSKPVMGPSENYYKFDRCYAKSYLCEHYQPYRLVLAASGCFSHHDIVCEAQKTFGFMSQTSCEQDYGPCRFTGSEILYRNDSLPYTHFAFAVEAAGYGGVEYWKLKVMQYIMGKWHKSQIEGYTAWPSLAQCCSVSNLADCYEAFYVAYRDVGLWGVYLCVPNGTDMDDTVYSLHDNLKRLCFTIQYSDVQRAIDTLKLDLARGVDGSVKSCYDMGFQMLYKNCRQNLLELFNLLDTIKVAEVKECAFKYLYDRCPVVVAVGATESLPEYNRLRSGMWWLRY